MRKGIGYIKKCMFNNKKIFFIVILLLLGLIYVIPHSFAVLQPIRSVEIFSEKLNYQNNESGAWKVTNSAKWISKNKAKLKIEVDSINAVNSKNVDVVFVLNNSILMTKDDKLNNAITSVNDSINKILLSDKNKAALLSFNDDYEILSDFTSDKELLVNKLGTLTSSGESSSYYRALVGIDKLLQDYKYDNDRECVVIFLASFLPTKDVPNEKSFYKFLKGKYPFLTINTVQYDMGNTVLKEFKDISDNVYLGSGNLNEAIYEAVNLSESYNYFSIKYKSDSNYFKIESVSNNEGYINRNTEDNSVEWIIDRYASGKKVSLEIDLQRNNFDYDYYIVNNKVEVISSIKDMDERVITSSSPILKDEYQVSYDGNFPGNCSSDVVPKKQVNKVFDVVGVSDVKLECEGYNFKGWRLKTSSVENINDDYFILPEEDVLFVAEWSKTSLKKSVDGTIYKHIPPVLQAVTETYDKEIWGYKDSITKIVIQDVISDISGTIQSYDISEKKDGKIIGRIVSNGNNTFTAYIQGDGKIMANTNSSYLFYNFSNLTSIYGLNKLDTSNTVDMQYMFDKCFKLTSIDCSAFNTSKVENMAFLFGDCLSLEYIDTSKFITSKVTDMCGMFYNCIKLTNLDLRNFNTSNVTNMGWMFSSNYQSPMMSLTSIDVSSFNTSKVTNMDGMFYNCANIKSLNLSKFDTSKVTSLEQMFHHCENLESININELVIGDVTSLWNVFTNCYKLSANVTIKGNNITVYTNVFINASISNGAKITVNYTSTNSALVDKIIAVKSSNSNVVKGRIISA